MLDRIRAFCHPGSRPYLYWSDGGAERRIQMRADSQTAPLQRGALDIGLSFRCPYPYAESATETETWVVPGVAAGGRTYPLTFPRTYPTGGGGPQSVLNSGNMPGEWVARIFGACDDPVLVNTATDQSIVFVGLSITAGDYVELDSARKTVRVNGSAAANRFHLLSPTTEWFQMVPGANPIAFDCDTPGSTAMVEIISRSTWL